MAILMDMAYLERRITMTPPGNTPPREEPLSATCPAPPRTVTLSAAPGQPPATRTPPSPVGEPPVNPAPCGTAGAETSGPEPRSPELWVPFRAILYFVGRGHISGPVLATAEPGGR